MHVVFWASERLQPWTVSLTWTLFLALPLTYLGAFDELPFLPCPQFSHL